jgi:Cytochrome c oxidase subunit IV
MADELDGGQLQPPSEEVHLPEPSYLPALVALGVTLALVGVILTWFITGIGVVIAVVAIVRWIRQTREEMAELPLEH